MHKSAGIFITDGKSVLLLKRSPRSKDGNTWGVPGGHARDGESPLQTAKRETKEEIGRSPDVFFEEHIADDWVCYFSRTKNKFTCTLSNEHADWKWINFKDLDNYELHPALEKLIETYLKIVTTSS